MKKGQVVRSLAGLLLFSFGVATGLVAQTSTDSPQRVEQKRTDLTGAPGMEVIASIAEYKPGDGIDRHFHHGVEAAYVVQGASVQAPRKLSTIVRHRRAAFTVEPQRLRTALGALDGAIGGISR